MSRYNWMVAGILLLFLSVAGYLVISARADMVAMEKDRAKTAAMNKAIMAEKKRAEAAEKKRAPKSIMDRVGEKVVTDLTGDGELSLADRILVYNDEKTTKKKLDAGSTRIYVFGSGKCESCKQIEKDLHKAMEKNRKTLFVTVDYKKFENFSIRYGVNKELTVVVEKENGEDDVVAYREEWGGLSESKREKELKKVIELMD